MRVVLDTNVLVSAIIARGVSRRLLDLWREGRTFDLVVCPMLLDELSDVLHRERFRDVIAPDEADALVTFLRNEADLVADPIEIPAVTSDPDDDYLVALATREHAEVLVSGDQDLRELTNPGFVVLSPAEALTRFSPPD